MDNGAPEAAISAAQAAATALAAQQPTPILRLDNMVKAHQLLEPQERADVRMPLSPLPAALGLCFSC